MVVDVTSHLFTSRDWSRLSDPAPHGVEPAGKLSSLLPRPRGSGGRGWSECVQLVGGYASVASLDDSTVAFIFLSTTPTRKAGRGLRNGRLVLAVRAKL